MKHILAEIDFRVYNDGSVSILTPITDTAREWTEGNVYFESWQTIGGGICIDHRFLVDLIEGILSEGFTIVDQHDRKLSLPEAS
ncbi:MAG: hypothetical protein H0W86_00060 [Armatimonadetes bacterium]|nr:hypothetical protein [Armatimonadota bacterium]